ncbi:MAG: DUF2309 domain-containing protein [Flectobacillus sp.]|nr:DUF2309 domain-containing protein [Flectobacillus sp.]
MNQQNTVFNEHDVLHSLKHYLPAQSPLKDFVHHNTLHAFQDLPFYKATRTASEIFGYKVSLTLEEYRDLYAKGRIREDILNDVLVKHKGQTEKTLWLNKLLSQAYDNSFSSRVGTFRANWKKQYRIDLDSIVQPTLFRTLCSYLDQGISIWNFPVKDKAFLTSLREMERSSFSSLFKTKKVKELFLHSTCEISDLLALLVGDEKLYTQYLYDQQFSHQGWSGIVSAIEDQPSTLLDTRQITTHDLIVFELLLELDALYAILGDNWLPLSSTIEEDLIDLFADVPERELDTVLNLWQEAFEWSYYDEALAGLQIGMSKNTAKKPQKRSFQALFCIDDRECSIRRHVEILDTNAETFGTPGFFGIEFFYQPQNGKFYTKVCPAPVTPTYLIKEYDATKRKTKDPHFHKGSNNFYSGWLISQTLGFSSAVKLFFNVFKPTMSPATSSSLQHMDKYAKLTIDHEQYKKHENGLQIGFTVEEMAQRLEGVFKSIGLVKDFAPIVYLVGHGASTINNPHYAGYDCGACCGRAGSVNARVFSSMANNHRVRAILRTRGIEIPDETQFVGALHDTTRDDIVFFDEDILSPQNAESHEKNEVIFTNALDGNAKERSRRFMSIDTKLSASEIHEKIRLRSVSLFEPRPELNHATNALTIVGRRELSKKVFLDRRSFLNSYDYAIDPEGNYLFNILKAATPVSGGINLEYYFSRVDNQKLGAGTKLPHNVMGLFGVANGIDGDLRPGLPSQMIEVHDPIRMLFIVEHLPEVVLSVIQRLPAVYEWYVNDWVKLVVINPETQQLFVFKEGSFTPYEPITKQIETVSNIETLVESHQENFPVYLIS